MRQYSLLLYPPVLPMFSASGGTITEPANLIESPDWRRSIRAIGGFWQGSCTVTGTAANLTDAFYRWLGYHLVERCGSGITWEGMVYELDLNLGDNVRRRSLDMMYNAVSCTYQVEGVVTEMAYDTVSQSVSRYGRREEKLLVDNYPVATAQAYRDRFLAENGWPWARPVSLGPRGEASLQLRACGYAFTANWMFVEEGDGTADDVDDWMAEVVGTATGLSSNHGGSTGGAGDCQFLQVGHMATNTLQVTKELQTPMRAWDLLAELAALGDATGDPWQVWVDVNREVHYQEISTPPRYYLRNGVLYSTETEQQAVNPYAVRPAVVRDMDYPVRGAEQGSWLEDRRDAFIEEVEVDATGQITLRTAMLLEADALAAQYGRYKEPERLPWAEYGRMEPEE